MRWQILNQEKRFLIHACLIVTIALSRLVSEIFACITRTDRQTDNEYRYYSWFHSGGPANILQQAMLGLAHSRSIIPSPFRQGSGLCSIQLAKRYIQTPKTQDRTAWTIRCWSVNTAVIDRPSCLLVMASNWARRRLQVRDAAWNVRCSESTNW